MSNDLRVPRGRTLSLIVGVTDGDGNIKMQVCKTGVKYYQDGKYLGFIGTNMLNGTDKRGLVFDLDLEGDYMSWGVMEETGGNYNQKFAYDRETDTFTFSSENVKCRNLSVSGSLTIGGREVKAVEGHLSDGSTMLYWGW